MVAFVVCAFLSTIKLMARRGSKQTLGCSLFLINILPSFGMVMGVSEQEKSIPELIKRLHSFNDNDQKAAADELIQIADTSPEMVVEALTDILEEKNPKVPKLYEWAAYSVGNIQWGNDRTKSRLLALIENVGVPVKRMSSGTPAVAAWAVGRIGDVSDEAYASRVLLNALKHGDPPLKENAAFALGELSPNSSSVINGLIIALQQDGNSKVRRSVADSLRSFGASAAPAIPYLVEVSIDAGNSSQVKAAALKSVIDISKSLRDSSDLATAKLLSDARKRLSSVFANHQSLKVDNAIRSIEQTVSTIQSNSPTYFLIQHATSIGILSLIGAYCSWALLIHFVILRLWPRSMLGLYERLPLVDVPLPKSLFGEMKIPFRTAFTAGQQYDIRGLDAWVENRMVAARKYIEGLRDRERCSYVAVPIDVNNKTHSDFSIKTLRETCSEPTWSLSIVGEGGLGKTTLAYELALSALDSRKQFRLCRTHAMIPVIIELNGRSESLVTYAALLEEIRVQLKAMAGEERVPSEALSEELLRRRRLLLILDDASETFQDGLDSKFRDVVNALVLTSRTDGKATRRATTKIRPKHIKNRALFRLVDHYLETYGKELTMTEMSELAHKISITIGENRKCTPLLAKLFAQHLVNSASDGAEAQSLTDVPDLFLEYIQFLNRERGARDPDDTTLHSACKILAWECVQKLYGARPCCKAEAALRLKKAGYGPEIISYCRQLGIVNILLDPERIVFSTDTVAEYLASLYVLEKLQTPKDWADFVQRGKEVPGAPASARGFLAAVCDCLMTRGERTQIPDWLLSELKGMVRAADGEPPNFEPAARRASA